jgi:hypothetical protein
MLNLKNLESVAIELREVMAAKAILESREKNLRAEIIEGLQSRDLSLAKVGSFTVSIRKNKNWIYSKWVRTLEKMLKTRKTKEQNNGTATFEENPTWQFLTIGTK